VPLQAVDGYAIVTRNYGVGGGTEWLRGWVTMPESLLDARVAHASLGPTSLVMFDVSTLYFETDAGDGFREPGFCKERRLEPQITIGLLTDASGFPLMVAAFEGNRAETTICQRTHERSVHNPP